MKTKLTKKESFDLKYQMTTLRISIAKLAIEMDHLTYQKWGYLISYN